MATTGENKIKTPPPQISAYFGEVWHWLWFSVLFALAQLWLVPLGFYMANKPWTIIELLGNGSLLFFATTITSKTAGEYFKRVRGHHAIATPMCVICLISILLPSVFAYGIEAATRVGVTASESLSPGRVTRVSLFLAGSAILFSLSYTLFVHAFGD